MRIVVCSDLHLDRYTAGLCRYEDVSRSVRAVVSLAKSEGCDGFVCLGDIANPGPLAFRCCAFTIEMAGSLADEGIWNRWVDGNHDVVEDGSGSSTLSPLAAYGRTRGHFLKRRDGSDRVDAIRAIDVWEGPCSELLDCGVLAVALPHPARGRGYIPSEVIENSAFIAHDLAIIFGHLTVPGIERGSEVLDMPRGREVRYPIEAIRERWGDRAVMLNGHYHRSYRRAQGLVIIPGSLERLTKSEARNEPGCLILEV